MHMYLHIHIHVNIYIYTHTYNLVILKIKPKISHIISELFPTEPNHIPSPQNTS